MAPQAVHYRPDTNATLMKRYLLLTALIPFATGAFALTAFISENSPAICTYATGSLSANPSGGSLPYTYLWSNGATTQTNNGLIAGSYTVVVTDAALDEVTADAVLFSEPYALESGSSGLPWCTAPRQAFTDPLVSERDAANPGRDALESVLDLA